MPNKHISFCEIASLSNFRLLSLLAESCRKSLEKSLSFIIPFICDLYFNVYSSLFQLLASIPDVNSRKTQGLHSVNAFKGCLMWGRFFKKFRGTTRVVQTSAWICFHFCLLLLEDVLPLKSGSRDIALQLELMQEVDKVSTALSLGDPDDTCRYIICIASHCTYGFCLSLLFCLDFKYAPFPSWFIHRSPN